MSAPHEGTPAATLSTCPLEPIGSLLSVFAPLAYNISPVVYVLCPVPPEVAPSEELSVREPAVRSPIVALFAKRRLEVAVPKNPVPETVIAVELAYGLVNFVPSKLNAPLFSVK